MHNSKLSTPSDRVVRGWSLLIIFLN